jgi:hypothetical protein
MFLALRPEKHQLAIFGTIRWRSYTATMMCAIISKNDAIIYRGRRPTSSENGAVKSGTRAKASGYIERPSVARVLFVWRSRSMESKPEL